MTNTADPNDSQIASTDPTGVTAPAEGRPHYHVLAKNDPVAALNILRQAGGLEPLPSDDIPFAE